MVRALEWMKMYIHTLSSHNLFYLAWIFKKYAQREIDLIPQASHTLSLHNIFTWFKWLHIRAACIWKVIFMDWATSIFCYPVCHLLHSNACCLENGEWGRMCVQGRSEVPCIHIWCADSNSCAIKKNGLVEAVCR